MNELLNYSLSQLINTAAFETAYSPTNVYTVGEKKYVTKDACPNSQYS